MGSEGSWLLIVRKGQVFVPTMAKTEAGFYLGIAPVEVVELSNRIAIESAVRRAIGRGNPSVPTPTRRDYADNPILKAAGVKSASAFERLAHSWMLAKHEHSYRIIPYHKSSEGLVEDREREEIISSEVALDEVIRRLVQRAIDTAESA